MTREEQIAYLTEWLEEKVLFSNKDREVLTAAKQALQERKEGRWERHYIRPGVYADLWFHATCCGSVMSFVTDYCPYCGARMVKEDEQDARK